MNEKQKAFQLVFSEFLQCPLFRGECDRKNGNDHFMFGISTVGEWLANGISEECADEYCDLFAMNFTDSGVKPQ